MTVFAPTATIYGRVAAPIDVDTTPATTPAPAQETVTETSPTVEPTVEPAAPVQAATKIKSISRKWAIAAISVLPEDGSSLSVKEILSKITESSLMDEGMSRVVKPAQSLARDLREYGRVAGSGIKQTGPGQFARG